MRTLAKAKPNKEYRWYRCLTSITLEARICNNRIVYYEVKGMKEHRLSDERIKSLFPMAQRIKEQPFLMRENKDFFTVMNRHRMRYKERYQQIKQTVNRKSCRTRF